MDSSSDNPNPLTASGGANSGGPVNAGAPNSDGSLRIDHHVHRESAAQPAPAESATPTPAEPFVENSVPVEPAQTSVSEPVPSAEPMTLPNAGPVTSEATPVPTSANVASESSFEQSKPTPAGPYVPEEEPANASTPVATSSQGMNPISQSSINMSRPTNPFPNQLAQPIAPIGDEGIVIGGNEPPKKSKKWLVVVVVAVVAAGLLVLAAIFIFKYIDSKPSVAKVRQNFAVYKEYLIHGNNPSEEAPTTWKANALIEEGVYGYEEYDQFFASLKEKYDNYRDMFNQVSTSFSDNTKNIINQYDELFGVYHGYATKEGAHRQKILRDLIDNGAEYAEQEINKEFNPNGQEGSLIARYKELLQSYMHLSLKVDEIYLENGCVQDYALVVSCVSNIGAVNEEVIDLNTQKENVGMYFANNFRILENEFIGETNKVEEVLHESDK